MDFQLKNIVRDNIQKLTAYSSAREDFTEKAEVYLDANENPYNNGINRYPDPFQKDLKKIISDIKQIKSEQILLGNGSDEVLDIIIRTFCEPKEDNIIICPPTYGMYKVLADVNNVEAKEVLLKSNFDLDIENIVSTANQQTKIIILCSPNNPTANSIPKKDLEFLLSKLNSIIVVDEAYIDFSTKKSAVRLLDKYPNLIVSQTLSKARGMAGIRVGMAFAQKEIIDIFNKVKPPYNINTLSQEKASNSLLQEGFYQEKLERILAQKDILIDALQKNSNVEHIFSSDANFILARFNDAKATYNYLTKNGVVVRDRSSQPLCENCLRISIGTEYENKILIEKLNEM